MGWKMEVSTSAINKVFVGLVFRAVNQEISKDFLCSTMVITLTK